jgi:DNA helicase-2/ATP-dependent DNA helicase PcrA
VQGVTLASLHAAKGLEWDAVFLVGLTEGVVPIQHAKSDEQLAEERRLLYVGITRARSRLNLSWALARTPGGRRSRRPSRFLDVLRAGRRDLAGATTRAGARSSRRTVAASAADAELFGRLRAWRRKQAEAQGVPPYVVFSDATLVAIADAHPQDLGELSRIAGVGPVKLARYSGPLLAAMGGAEPDAVSVQD